MGRVLRTLAIALSLAILTTLLPVLPAYAAPTTDYDRAGQGIASFAGTALGRIGDNDILSARLPMTARSIRELLGLDTVFANTLGSAVDDLSDADAAGLESAIEGATATENGVTVTYADAAVETPATVGDPFTISFSVAASASATLPIAYEKVRRVVAVSGENGPDDAAEDELVVGLVGDEGDGGIQVDVDLAPETLTFEFDPELRTTPGTGLTLTNSPDFAFTATGDNADVDFDSNFGFADIAVSGSAAFDLAVDSPIVNGDGLGGVTYEEWTSMLPEDLFATSRVNVADTSDVAVALDFDSSLIEGATNGSLDWQIADASNVLAADEEPTLCPDPTANSICNDGADLVNFANVSPDDVLAGLGLYATVLTGAEATSSQPLPFLDASLSEAYSPAGKLTDLVRRHGEGAVVCGKADTQPPSGLGLPGTAWYCQAYTSIQPASGTISWSIANGSEAGSQPSVATTIGVAPTANYAFTVAEGQTRPDVSISFEDADGGDHTLVPRFATVDQLEDELNLALFDNADADPGVQVGYSGASDGLTFGIALDKNPDAITANIDFGDILRNSTRLAGLHPSESAGTGNATATVDASGFSLNSTFGVDLSADLAALNPDTGAEDVQGDRFFTLLESGPEFEIDDVSVTPTTAAYELDGKVGFVDVLATGATSNSLSVGSNSSTDPMLAVDFAANGLTNGTGHSNSLLLTQILKDPVGFDSHVTPIVNLEAEAHLDVEPTGNLASLIGSSDDTRIDVEWTDVATNFEPDDVTMGAGYSSKLLPLDIAPQITGFDQDGADDTSTEDEDESEITTVKDPARDFTVDLGVDLESGDQFPGTLYNITTGASCYSIEIVSDTEIKCATPVGAEEPSEPTSWLAGGADRHATPVDANGDDCTDTNGDGDWDQTGCAPPVDNDWDKGDGYMVEGDPAALGPIVLESFFDVVNRFENHTEDGFTQELPLIGLAPKDFTPQFADVGAAMHSILEDFEDTADVDDEGDDATFDVTDEPPASMQELIADIEAELDLGDADLSVALEELTRPSGADPMHLVLRMGTLDASGSDFPTPTPEPSPSATPVPRLVVQPTPTPDVLMNDVDSDPDLSATWSSKVKLNLAFPLDPEMTPNEVLVLSGTGVDDLDVTVDGTAMDFNGSYGAVGLKLGTDAKKTGAHDVLTGTQTAGAVATGDASETKVTGTVFDSNNSSYSSNMFLRDTTKNFSNLGLEGGFVLTNTTDNATCTISGVNGSFATDLICSGTLSNSGVFNSGDAYTYTWESATILTDTTANFTSEGVQVGMALENVTESAICRITAVAATKLTCSAGLSSSKKWSSGDDYKVTSTKTMTDSAADLSSIEVGDIITNTTDNATCTVSNVNTGQDTVTCSNALDGGSQSVPKWDSGDAWSMGGSSKTLRDPGADFDVLGIKLNVDTITNTTSGNESSCTITAVGPNTITCSAGLKKTGNVATTWNDGDTYELGGIGKAALDVSYSLKGSSHLLLDDATASNRYMDSLVGAFTGSSNDCGGMATTDDVCVRLSAKTQGGTPRYVGTFEFHSDADGGNAVSVTPAAATAAAAEAGAVMDFSLLVEPLRYVPTMVRYQLNGNNSEEFPSIPMIGSDLGVGADVADVLDLLSVSDSWDTVTSAAAGADNAEDLEGDVAAAIKDLVAAEMDGVSASSVPVTVTAKCGSNNCGTSDGLNKITDLKVEASISDNVSTFGDDPTKGCSSGCGSTTKDIPFDLGLPGLNMKSLDNAQAEAKIAWSANLVFGLDKDTGPYLFSGSNGSDPEIEVGADVGFKDGCDKTLPPADVFAANTATPSDYSDSRCIKANVGLFEATLFDGANSSDSNGDNNPSVVKLLTEVDFKAPSGEKLWLVDLVEENDDTALDIDADGNMDLMFRTKEGTSSDPDLPVMYGTIHVGYDTDDPDNDGAPLDDVRYENLMLDSSSFFTQFVGAWLGEFAKRVKPVLPFISALSTPVPVVSEIAVATGNPPFTIIDLIEIAAAYKAKKQNDANANLPKDKQSKSWKYLVDYFIPLVRLAGSFPTTSTGTMGIGGLNGSTQMPGGFRVPAPNASSGDCGSNGLPTSGQNCKRTFKINPDTWRAGATQITQSVHRLQNCPSSGCTGRELTATLTSASPRYAVFQGAGVSFPWLNDAALLEGMLVGEDAVLVRLDTGFFSAGVGWAVSFGPFMAGPIPVEVYAGFTIDAGFRVAFGIDTAGIRAKREGDTSAGMLDGFFFDDYDDDGRDVPEVQLIFTVTIGASVSVRIFKVGIEGEVKLTIGLDLNDPNDNGRITAPEFRSMGSDPICMFDFTGFLDFVLRVFVEIDLVIWTKRWSYNLYKMPRQNLFEVGCDPLPPALAHFDANGDLELNMGSSTRRTARNYETEITAEKFVVRQLETVNGGTTKVSVTAFGLVQNYDVPDNKKIVASGDTGNDTIQFLAGNAADGTEVSPTLPAQFSGGTGDDTLEGGKGDDTLNGDDGIDSLKGGEGHDTLSGGIDRDGIDGGIGKDVISGGDGTDTLSGGAGADLVEGGAGDDTVSGGPGLPDSLASLAVTRGQPALTGSARSAAIARITDPGDLLAGNGGVDNVSGHFGDDYIFGDNITGASSSGRTLLDSFVTSASGAVNRATACAATAVSGDGADHIDGEAGLDFLAGGGANDELVGGKGGDRLCGAAGHDLVEGDSVTAKTTASDALADTLEGGAGDDRLYGRAGNDEVRGDGGNDYLDAADGDDKLDGGTGSDAVLGGLGKDIALGDDGSFGTLTISTAGTDVAGSGGPSISSTSGGGVAVCSDVVSIINGRFDVNGDGITNSSDSGLIAGIPANQGRADMDVDGVVSGDAGDNGVLNDLVVIADGLADLNGDGIANNDTGTLQLFTMRWTGDGSDCLRGGDDHDALFGGPGGDDISGDSGDDYVVGGSGDDVARGALDDDHVLGDAGMDTVYGDSGDDELHGGADADTVWGGLDDDLVFGNEDADTLNGDSGEDRIIGGSSSSADDGADLISGGDDDDVAIGDNGTISTAGVATLLDMQMGTDTVAATKSGADTMFGGPADDLLYGQGANDLMTGDGDDVPSGTEGEDHLVGGAGSDIASGGKMADELIGGSEITGANDANATRSSVSQGDELNGGEGTDFVIGDNGTIADEVMARLDDATTGDSQDDATSGDDTLFGDADGDRLQGGGGNDSIYGDNRVEAASGSGSVDKIQGNAGADTIYGHGGNDEIAGGSAIAGIVDENVSGAGDTIYGHEGVDKLFGDNASFNAGGTGSRILADDPTTSDSADNTVSGNDTIYGDAGTDTIEGEGGNDTIYGDARTADSSTGSPDSIQGNAGADLIYGHGGIDSIIGGSNTAGVVDENVSNAGDVIYGHAGNDLVLGDNGTISGSTLSRFNDSTTTDSDDNATSGDDDIFGDEGVDRIQAQGGADLVYGDDRIGTPLASGSGEDVIQGNAGPDEIHGGAGVDDLTGGTDTAGVVDSNVGGVGDTIYGDAGDDNILGDNGTISGGNLARFNDATTGDAADDSTSGDDDIYGDGGLDEIQAQGGDDVVYGDDRTAEPTTAGSNDLIQGNAGSDVVYGHGGVDDIIGGSAAQGIVDETTPRRAGGSAGDEIYGHAGDDRILGDNGTITGGVLARLNDATSNDGADDTTSGDDDIYGDAGIDTIQAQGGDDVVFGDDRPGAPLVTGSGTDLIQGNAGSDVIHAGDAVDDVIGGSDIAGVIDESTSRRGGAITGDEIHGNGGDDNILGDNGTITNGVLARLNDATAAGDNSGDDEDNSTSGADDIYGNSGTDDIQAQGGNDDVYGDAEVADSEDGALDRIQGNAGADDIYGHGGDDDITGGTDTAGIIDTNVGDRGDHIYGHAGVDRILGDNGTIDGNGITRFNDATSADSDDNLVSNDDDLWGDAGVDKIESGGGDDVVYGDDRSSASTSTGSDDVIQTNAGSDVVYGHGGNDDITGGSDDAGRVDANVARRGGGTPTGDEIDGGPGVDMILGDNGTLTGGSDRKWKFFDIDYAGDAPSVSAAFSGKDTIVGSGEEDWIFGQGDEDTISGSGADDRIQGNAGTDIITGDGGADDIVGGSAFHFDPNLSYLPKVLDARDVISGSNAAGNDVADKGDVIVGDNGSIERLNVPADPNTSDAVRKVQLFDVEKAGGYQPPTDAGGADDLKGFSGRDFIYGQAKNDAIAGGDGDDSIEGNAGLDDIDAENGNDDVIGGSSVALPANNSNPTEIGSATFENGTRTDAADATDDITGGNGDDAVLADNGEIKRVLKTNNSGLWDTYPAPWNTLLRRNVLAPNAVEVPGAFGNDVVDGGPGHDEIHGQLGQDTIDAQHGDDSVIGDLGKIDMVVQEGTGQGQAITASANFITTNINVPGTLRRNTTLFVQSATGAGDVDTITGGNGNDVVHSGLGNDVVNGNGTLEDDTDGSLVAALTLACKGDTATNTPPNPLECDHDILFGDDGADRIWGGPDHDHIYGGWGTDFLDYVFNSAGDPTVDYKGADFIYGGWDADVMQADLSKPNPNGLDKLIDAQGAYNAYNICEGAYGGNSSIRAVDPGMISFLQRMASDDGAVQAATTNSSGFRELSIIFSKDVKANSSPIYPGTPLNFTCSEPSITVQSAQASPSPSPSPSSSAAPTTTTLVPAPTPSGTL